MADASQCACLCTLTKTQTIKGGSALCLLVLSYIQVMAWRSIQQHIASHCPVYFIMLSLLLSFLLSALLLYADVRGHIQIVPRFQSVSTRLKLKLSLQGIFMGGSILCFRICSMKNTMLAWQAQVLIPLLYVVLRAVILRHGRPSLHSLTCTLLMTAGSTLALYTASIFKQNSELLVASLFACAAAVLSALSAFCSEYGTHYIQMGAVNMVFYTAIPAAACLLPFVIVVESDAVLEQVINSFWMHTYLACALAVLLLLLQVAWYQTVRYSSALLASLLSFTIQPVCLLLLTSILTYHSGYRLSLLNQAGLALCYAAMLGFAFQTNSAKIDSYQFVQDYNDEVQPHINLSLTPDLHCFTIESNDDYDDDGTADLNSE